MKYEIYAHLPQQMENFYNAFAQGDIPLLERILDNLQDIIKDNGFQKDLKEYDDKRKEQFDNIQKKALESIKTLSEAKNINEVYIDLEEMKNDLTAAVDTMESEYWDKVKGYVSGWVQQLDIEQPK